MLPALQIKEVLAIFLRARGGAGSSFLADVKSRGGLGGDGRTL